MPARVGMLLALLAVTAGAACAAAHGASPTADALGATSVEIPSGSGCTLRGWFLRGRGAGAVLLLHGVGASRLEMVGRARFLSNAGYSILLVDFRGHGESSPARPTYGGLESLDARAALEFLRAMLPRERIGVIGVSLGGAAALLGPAPLPVQALVLESVYPTIEDAVRDRLRAWLGALGQVLAPVATRVLLPRDGVAASDLRPIDRIHEQVAPVFVIAGTADPYTPIEETRAFFAHAPDPKDLWEVEGAAHVDLHAFASSEYERKVGAFLALHLRSALPSVAVARAGAKAESEHDAQRPDPSDGDARPERRDE